MEEDSAPTLPDLALLDVLRLGASDDLQSVLLLCDAWQAGQRGRITVEAPMLTAPNLVTALIAAQTAAVELQAASSVVPATPRPLRAAGATAAPSAPTSPSAPGAVVSFLLQGAWLHVQLDRADAVKLQEQLARVNGPG